MSGEDAHAMTEGWLHDLSQEIMTLRDAGAGRRLPRRADALKTSAAPPPLDDIARLSLSVGRLLLEAGASARTVHEAVQDICRGGRVS